MIFWSLFYIKILLVKTRTLREDLRFSKKVISWAINFTLFLMYPDQVEYNLDCLNLVYFRKELYTWKELFRLHTLFTYKLITHFFLNISVSKHFEIFKRISMCEQKYMRKYKNKRILNIDRHIKKKNKIFMHL